MGARLRPMSCFVCTMSICAGFGYCARGSPYEPVYGVGPAVAVGGGVVAGSDQMAWRLDAVVGSSVAAGAS